MKWFKVQVTKELPQDDVPGINFSSQVGAIIYIAQTVSDADGYRLIGYEDFSEGAFLRPGSTARLRVFGEVEDGEIDFESTGDALEAVALLHPSDGFFLYDFEAPGSNQPSVALNSRPSMWLRHYQEPASNPGVLIDSRENSYGRNEADRI